MQPHGFAVHHRLAADGARLDLLGVDVGARWTSVADAFATEPCGRSAFTDSLAVMAFAMAGRMDDARGVVEAQDAAIAGPGDHALAAALEAERAHALPVADGAPRRLAA